MGKQLYRDSRPLGSIGGLVAFVLSAAMGVAFVMLVDKTHNLFSGGADGTADMAGAISADQAVVGTWQGKWHDVPSVTVTIGRQGNQLTGTVIFQAVHRTAVGAQLSGASVTVPLKDARFDGRTLRFKLDDSRAARELRESGIEMTLTSANHAELKLAACKQDGGWDCEEVIMTKTA